MSRRAKQIILGIVLVLVVIPAGYVAFTWYPSQPLHLRLVHVYPEEHRDGRGHRMLRVSVQNPNPMPVHVFFVRLDFERSIPDINWSPAGYIDPEFQKESGSAATRDGFVLAPGSTNQVTAFLHPVAVDAALHEGMIADYACMSATHYKVAMAYGWLRDRCPQSLQKLFPPAEVLRTSAPVSPALD